MPAWATSVLLIVCVAASMAAPQKGGGEDYHSGAYLYRTFCASCHGETGRGDGPVADLGPRPSDLTRLTASNGGVFPRADVRAVLEGARPAASHHTSTMPKWREVLARVERADERTLNARIDALVAHVESLQR